MLFQLLRKLILEIKRRISFLFVAVASKFGEINTDKLAANIVGPFSLILISILTLDVVLALYCCVVKWIVADWPLWRVSFHAIAGHFVVASIIYHYYFCAFTDPGLPLSENNTDQFPNSGWCRKCSAVKPPLTHHCSVCKRCVLRMDHHCTWTNNCIGLYNHRHFFLFCFFMCTACLYCFTSGSEVYYQHTLYGFGYSGAELVSTESGKVIASLGRYKFDCKTQTLTKLPAGVPAENLGHVLIRQTVHPYRKGNRTHRFAVVAMYLCFLFFVLLAGLVLWHAWLISLAHTSIDNMGGATKSLLQMPFQEIITNWKLFLGMNQPDGSFFNRFLLPSRHPPTPLKIWISRAPNDAQKLAAQTHSAHV